MRGNVCSRTVDCQQGVSPEVWRGGGGEHTGKPRIGTRQQTPGVWVGICSRPVVQDEIGGPPPQHKSPLTPTPSWCHLPGWRPSSSHCRRSWPAPLCLSWGSGSSISASRQGPAAWKAGGGDGCNTRARAGPWRARQGAVSCQLPPELASAGRALAFVLLQCLALPLHSPPSQPGPRETPVPDVKTLPA